MPYTFPNLKNSSLAYKGRRFWIIEIAEGDNFDSITKEDADYIFYDAQYQAIYGAGLYAKISKTDSNKFLVQPTTTHVDMSFEVDTLRNVVKTLPKVMESYLQTCFG
ncbi:MAG: hypothetical protein KC592_19900 [Nitrospira sp.]|nr:hypothetical protein [Nitrospira sp.]